MLKPSTTSILSADDGLFRQCFGRSPFALKHNLSESGLFTIDRLKRVTDKMVATGRGGRMLHFEIKPTRQAGGAKFVDTKHKLSFSEAMERLGTSRCWIDLINVCEFDPELAELSRIMLRDIENILGVPIMKDINHCYLNVFLTSPNVITPYHFDHTHTFLCQIKAEKDVKLWNPSDRQNLPDADIERFYFEELDHTSHRLDFGRSTTFHLSPGAAVHHPSIAPHWVQNGPDISISVGLNFSTKALERRTRIYQANRMIRKAGFTPPPPFKRPLFDAVRAGAVGILNRRSPRNLDEALFSGIRKVKRCVKRLKAIRSR